MNLWIDIKKLLNEISQKGFFNLLSANVLIQIVAFVSQLFVAGILSPEDIGRIKILQTWLSIFSIVGSMGFASSTLKLCSENRTKEEVQALFRSGLFFTLISTIGTYLLVLIINQLGLLSQDVTIKALVPLALFPLISNVFFSLYVSYHQANKNIKLISNLTSVNKILSLLLILGFTYILGVKGYYIGYNISLIILLAVAISITKLPQARHQPLVFSKANFRSHWDYARPSFFSVLLHELSAYSDILLINFLIKDSYDIGQYSFALTLTVIIRVFPSTVQQITIPYFSKLSANKLEFTKTLKKYSNILLIVIASTLIGALILVPPIIKLVFAGKYNDSITYFIPLVIGWSIRQYNQIQSAALFGGGKMNYIAKSQFITLIFSLTVIYSALNIWGLIGAAYASILCSVFIVMLLRGYLKKFIRTE